MPLHVIGGLLLLGYVGILPNYGPTVAPPYRPYHTVALYWHFVDFVWIFIVALLYVIPNIQIWPLIRISRPTRTPCLLAGCGLALAHPSGPGLALD